MISGEYAEFGDAAKKCSSQAEPCHLLSYALLSGGISYKEAFDGGEYLWPRSPQVQVRLNQPNERTLEISVLDIQGKSVREETLSMDVGDFSCDEENLILKGRSIIYLIGLDNIVGSISRRFSRSSDGALVLESRTTVIGHSTIFPVAGTANAWVRWPPVETAEVRAELAKQAEKVLTERAKLGDAEAAFALAKEYKELRYLQEMAARGNRNAIFLLARAGDVAPLENLAARGDREAIFALAENSDHLGPIRELAVAGDIEAAMTLARRSGEKEPLYELADKGNVNAAVDLAKVHGDHKPLRILADSGNEKAIEAFNSVSCEQVYYRAGNSAKEQASDKFVQVCEGRELSDEETVKVFVDWGPPEGARYRTYFKITPEALK